MPEASIGHLLRIKREQRGLSAGALSAAAHLSRSYMAKVESGEIAPSLRAFAQVAHVLQLTSHEILAAVRIAGADADERTPA